jgi:hypothetical protein
MAWHGGEKEVRRRSRDVEVEVEVEVEVCVCWRCSGGVVAA